MLNIKSFINPILIYIKKNTFVKKYYNFTYKTQKYSPQIMLEIIEKVLKSGISWRDINIFYGNFKNYPKWNTVFKFYKKLIERKIIFNTYKEMLKTYFVRGKNKKLSYRYTDTSFIYSRNGGECVKFNKFFGRKKCCKLSLITDVNGIPYNIGIYEGNIHDSLIFIDQLKSKNIVDIDTNNYKGKGKYKEYFLADSGYDTNEIKLELEKLGLIPLIPQNKRNIKNPNKIKKFTEKEPHL